MKTSVVVNDLGDLEIRPGQAYAEYTKLLRRDLADLLLRKEVKWIERVCPGCGGPRGKRAFERDGLVFFGCEKCNSLFVSPVPDQGALDAVRRTGLASSFRRELALGSGAQRIQVELRHELLHWVRDTCSEQDVSLGTVCQVGEDDPIWLDLIRGEARRLIVVEPTTDVCFEGGDDGNADAVICLASLDKVADPQALLGDLVKALRPGGVMFLATSSADGLEYQVLGGDAPNLRSLDRLTIFSTKAICEVLNALGMNVTELSTPGRLDAENVRRELCDPSSREVAFWSRVFAEGDAGFISDLQLFLQRNLLCSYLRVAAVKRTN